MADTPCEIKLGNQVLVGTYPRLPMRFLLQRELQRALGYTEADLREMGELEEGDPIPEPSLAGDDYAIACVYAAAIGVCWPTPLPVPSLKELRHDVVAFGEAIIEHFAQQPGHDGKALAGEGRRLLYDMVGKATKGLKQSIAEERDFTAGRGAASTVA